MTAIDRLRADYPRFAKRKAGETLRFTGYELKALSPAQRREFMTMAEDMLDRCVLAHDAYDDYESGDYIISFKKTVALGAPLLRLPRPAA